jgi:hypothetical protein
MSNLDNHHDHTPGRACAECGTSLEGKRSDAIYCSTRCRNRVVVRRRYHADLETARAKERAKGKLRTAKRRLARAVASVAPKASALELLAAATAILTGQPSATK